MSRRKQANPRPLKAQEEEAIGQVAKGKCYAMVAKFEEFNENHDSDQDLLEYDEYAPLVVDTSRPPESDDEHDNHGQDQDRLQTTEADIGSFNHCDQDPGPVNVSTGELIKSLSTNAVLNQDQSNSSSEHDQLFIDSAAPSEISNNSRTPSISSLSDQLSPGGLSSSLSASKVHRRGKRNLTSTQDKSTDDNLNQADDSETKILPVASEGGENRYICPICQQVLSSSHDLTVHIRSHNSSTTANQANSCTICGKVLSSQSSLDRHMLVHSGERPFQCKICKMSFTTNGNMHRHARIHAKENDVNGIGPKVNRSKPKPPNWKSRMNFFSSPGAPSGLDVQQLTSPFRREFTAPSVGVSDSPVASTEVLTQGIKRSFNFINYTQEWPSSPAKQKCLPHNFTPPELPSTNHMTTSNYCNEVSTSSAKPQSEEVVVPDVKTQEQKSTVDGEETNVDQLHCPVCNKTFLCKYGLETHLETHPNFSMKCNFCHMSFPTPRGLNMHKLMVHSKDKSTEEENDKKNDLKCATVGFYDLSFMDFSVNKFSLVAKAWCEENARKSSSAFHNFQCKECAKAFPSKSSLLLHTNTHSTEKTAKCPLCECDFLDSSILHQHMLKHLSDKAFNDVMIKRKKEIVNSSPAKTDKIGKHDFLASFGLTTVSEAEILERKERGMKKESLIKMEKKENNEYFAKLGQVFSPDVSPIHPMLRKGLNLSPEEQAKSVMDLHKILQSSAGLTGLGQQGHIPGAETAGLNANNAKAFLPAMLPINIANSTNDLASLGNLTTLAAIMNSNPMFLSAMLANQSFSSPLPTPPPSSESGSGSSGEMSDKYANKSGLFQCKYCDQVFTNYRQLKGHTRTHLGLSPYKCNLCNYSSADKSTLIRHLRTHNGERPFMCRVCDFAFTTKANCERHVRKKHGKYMKEDIDAAIGYNKYVAESSTTAENFHSPDTVCKYCGEDFKFFRALKHHLRSHSSCRQKPFLCMRCEVGFSTKANCVRHLQKQHPEVSQYQIEQYIHVNEPGNEDGEKSSLEGLSDDGLPADCRSTGTPMSSASIPPAHSTPKTSFQNDSRSQTPVSIKQEPADPDDCPLDFSVKSGSSTPTPTLTKSGTDELPMDLTVRKKEDSPVNSKVSGQAGVTYDNTLFQCQFCPMGFSDSRVLERHLWQNHPQVAEIIDKQMKPYLSGQGVNHLSSSPGKLKLPLKPPVPVSSDDKLKLMTKLSKGSPKSLKDVYKPMEARANSQNLDSGSDLASVKRILDAAKAQTFNALLNEDSGASCQSEEDSMDSMSNKDEDVLHIAEVNGESNGAVPIDADEPPVLSPRSKGDSVNTSEDSRDKDMPEISASPEHFAQLFSVPKEAIPKTVLDPTDKSAVRKKRNSYADSPHKLQCPYCTRTFPWVSSLTRHLLTHTGQKPFKCPRCPVTFSTKSNRERHLIRKHGVNMLDPLSRQTMDRPYKCHLCVFSSFSTQGNLLKHYKERHLGCDLPDTLSDLDKAVTKGLSTTIPPHERGLIQDISSKIAHDSYIRDNRLNDAEEQRTMNASLGKSPNVDISDLPFLMPEDVKSDIEDEEDDIIPLNLNTSREDSPKGKIFTGSGERQINPERDNYNVDKITSCWKCGEKFVSRKLLVRHLKEHNIDLPFKCYLCDASYEVRKECLGHQETAHMSDWKILKEKNKVDDVETFAKHMDKVVENNCNKVDQGAVLEIPGQNADDPKMEVVSADYMQRKVYCSLCPKRFWSLQDLRRHMRSHTGERPFECDICQKRFTLKHSMMRHRKKHLESGSLSASDDEDMPPIEETPAGAKVTHHRPILPRMKPIPVLPVSIITSLPSAISLNTTLNGETAAESSAGYSMTTPRPNATISSGSSATSTITVESDAKDNSADILHNLLGVDVGSIDQMLDSADSAAKLLGM